MRKYLLIYLLFDGAEKEEPYIAYMTDALSVFCDKTIYLPCVCGDDPEKMVYGEWIRESEDIHRGIACVTSRLFGPFRKIESELEDFESGEEISMAYYDPETDIPDFFVVKRDGCFCEQLWRQNAAKRVVCNRDDFYRSGDYMIGGHRIGDCADRDRIGGHVNGDHAIKDCTIREDWFRPDTLIRRGNPFMNMECLAVPDSIRYTLGEEPARVISRIRRQKNYDEDMIWEAVLKRYNLYDIKRALHLNWVIQKEERFWCGGRRAAVFLHLFYEESLDEVMPYIREIPSGIDIYISTCAPQINDFADKLERYGVPVTGLLEAGRRGRDAGALLVAFGPHLMKYEYICFLHDKRSSGGLEPEAVGKSFMRLMWDSLLKDEGHIQGILRKFEENRRLGVLSPPAPIMGMYLKDLLGTEWTVCYEETQRLADRLGCRIKTDPDKPVFALSTSFWCRTKALELLFRYPWSYEDFPEEPLPLDGTINHAIERILIYIAQERGFYSAVITTAEYASVYMENQMYLLDTVFGELHRGNLLKVQFPLKLNTMLEPLCRLAVFCRTHTKLYLYGAGAQAEIMMKRLQNLRADIRGVVVTKRRNKEHFFGYQIMEFREIQNELDEECGIILAMSGKFQEEVIDSLEGAGVDYFRMEAEE